MCYYPPDEYPEEQIRWLNSSIAGFRHILSRQQERRTRARKRLKAGTIWGWWYRWAVEDAEKNIDYYAEAIREDKKKIARIRERSKEDDGNEIDRLAKRLNQVEKQIKELRGDN